MLGGNQGGTAGPGLVFGAALLCSGRGLHAWPEPSHPAGCGAREVFPKALVTGSFGRSLACGGVFCAAHTACGGEPAHQKLKVSLPAWNRALSHC